MLFWNFGLWPISNLYNPVSKLQWALFKKWKKKVGKSELIAPGEEGRGVRRVCFSLGVMALKGLEVTWKSLIRIDKIGQS